jgi:hypothetical protein
MARLRPMSNRIMEARRAVEQFPPRTLFRGSGSRGALQEQARQAKRECVVPQTLVAGVAAESVQKVVDSAPGAERPAAYRTGTCSAGLFSGRMASRNGDAERTGRGWPNSGSRRRSSVKFSRGSRSTSWRSATPPPSSGSRRRRSAAGAWPCCRPPCWSTPRHTTYARS